ncbi:hypothetical protein [Halomonas sp.]|uniref:hypothetical protein n=1 Tax=Halomonas sp. TaxID=1486246 RepID=UPI0038500B0D
MSRGGQIAADAVRDMLVGLADALRTAQDTLSEAGRISEGGMGYEIPYLDFTFEVEFSEQTSNQPSTAAPILKLFPRTSSSGGNRETDITSRISGRLVSTPTHGGRPAALLEMALVHNADGPAIDILLSNTAGERLTDAFIELQVDVDMTERLIGFRPTPTQRLALLPSQTVLTDEQGYVQLSLSTGSLGGKSVVVKAEAQGAVTRLIVGGSES